jgi:hypothetical protein
MEPKTGLFTDILPSGAGFITFEDGRQAFALPSLIRTMNLQLGDRVLCRLAPNFADKTTDRVPWRVLRLSIVQRADITLSVGSGMEDLLAQSFAFLESRGGSWTAEEMAEEMGVVEVRFVARALDLLFRQGRVHRSVITVSTSPESPEIFYAIEIDSLIPVGAVEDEEEMD